MPGEMGSPLIAVTTNHRVRPLVVVGMLAAIFAASVATGILLPRAGSGAGHVGDVPNLARSPMIDAWRLAVPAVPASPARPNRTVSSWLDIPAGVTVPAVSNRMIDAWRLAAR